MKILHVTAYYMDGMGYQENMLPKGQAELGHDVVVICGNRHPNYKHIRDERDSMPGIFYDGQVQIERLPVFAELNGRGVIFKSLLPKLYKYKPDLLFCHGIGEPIISCIIYKLLNPSVILQMDTHSTADNSGKSMYAGLYHGFFRIILQIFKAKFSSLFAISPETVEFMKKYYKLKDEDISFLPLPGDGSLMEEYCSNRIKFREKYNIGENEKVVIHTGKLPGEKLTNEVINAFNHLQRDDVKLIICGSIEDDWKNQFYELLGQNKNIHFLGWLPAEELRELFVASDLLCQPGSLSNTFLDAVCCGLPVILADTPQGRELTSDGNGILVSTKDMKLLEEKLSNALKPEKLRILKKNAKDAWSKYHYVNNAEQAIQDSCN